MADNDINAVAGLTQKVYDSDPVANVFDFEMSDVFRSHCDIESNGAGEDFNFSIVGAGSVVASLDYELAGGAIATYKFTVTPRVYTFRATVHRAAIDVAKMKGSKAVFQTQKMALDMALYEAWRKFDKHCAAKRGEIGIITAIAGSTITIGRVAGTADGWITNRLKPGMILVSGATPGTGNLRGSSPGDEEIVSSWNDATAVVTCASSISGNWQVGDTIWEKGDAYYDQTLKNGRRAIAGVPAWLDETAASNGENFFGQDRFDNSYDLEPMRVTLTSGTTARKGFVRALTRMYGQRGIAANLGFVPTTVWERFLLEEDNREIVTIEKNAVGKKIMIKLESVKISNGAGGVCEFYQWPYLASDFAYMGNAKQAPFKIGYTDRMVRLHEDGQGLWRRIRGGLADPVTGEKVAALEAEGDLRVFLYNKCPSRWCVVSGCTTLANP